MGYRFFIVGLVFFLFIWGGGGLSVQAKSGLQTYTVNPHTERIRMYWKKPDGEPYRSIDALLSMSNDRERKVRMVTNGGIYSATLEPEGLYIESGRRLMPLNTAEGEGNFFMKPNGVFFVGKNGKARIVDAHLFKESTDIEYAVQSGPLMIRGGVLHPRFLKDSTSRKIRNAVGINAEGRVTFFFSDTPVTFYDLARTAQECYAIVDMLYLDGSISTLYVAPDPAPAPRAPFVTMIAVEAVH